MTANSSPAHQQATPASSISPDRARRCGGLIPALISAAVWVAVHRKCSRPGPIAPSLAWMLVEGAHAPCLASAALIGVMVVAVACVSRERPRSPRRTRRHSPTPRTPAKGAVPTAAPDRKQAHLGLKHRCWRAIASYARNPRPSDWGAVGSVDSDHGDWAVGTPLSGRREVSARPGRLRIFEGTLPAPTA